MDKTRSIILRRPITFESVVSTAVTIGFSVAVARFVTHAFRQHRKHVKGVNKGECFSFWISIFQIFQRTTLRRDSSSREEVQGDEYYNTAYNRRDNDNEKKDDELIMHYGSCHCRSVCFSLLSKQDLIAYDSPGKIRYAYIPTSATEFQLTKGTEQLSIYYLMQPPESTMAAYAFCKQCGVHILHAPNKKLNKLQVNAHCLDSYPSNKVKVLFRDNGFISGVPIFHPRADGDGDVLSSIDHNPDQKQAGTPATSMTSASSITEQGSAQKFKTAGSFLSPDQESCSSIGSNTSTTSSPGLGIGGWAVGSSLNGIQMPSDTGAMKIKKMNSDITPSKLDTPYVMRDQMKYYMKKHLGNT